MGWISIDPNFEKSGSAGVAGFVGAAIAGVVAGT